jgi:hypothetical protein
MRSFRENPDSEENQRLTREHRAAVFAAKMAQRNDLQLQGKFRVQYAQPTSPYAKQFGFSEKGCWVVEYHQGEVPPVGLAGRRTKEEAEEVMAEVIKAERE